MSFTDVIKKVVVDNYCNFNGRAGRAEYWYFFLFNVIVSVVLSGLANAVPALSVLSVIYSLAMLLPGLGVAVRRMHDIGKSGWFLFISLVPCVGTFILLYFLAQDSEKAANAYGPVPTE